jgi:acylphosphatase
MTTYARYRVRIIGRVQGVGFRLETLREANRLGVTGWVRNAKDGSVEAVIEGEEGPVNAMIDWCWSGPSFSRVAGVETIPENYQNEFKSFTIAR